MLKICRKSRLLSNTYYKNNSIFGEVKNYIIFQKIIYRSYKITIKKYLDLILFFIVILLLSFKNLVLLFTLFLVLLLLRYIWSLCDISRITEKNNVVGDMNYILFSNTIKLTIYGNKYEIYSHGNNCFSIMKNNIQIALINTDGKIVANELCFIIDYIDDCQNILPLLVICIDWVFYKQKLGKRNNLICSKRITYNFHDLHKERLLWKNE